MRVKKSDFAQVGSFHVFMPWGVNPFRTTPTGFFGGGDKLFGDSRTVESNSFRRGKCDSGELVDIMFWRRLFLLGSGCPGSTRAVEIISF